ncbi:retrovirus-related pol polyprotein from transposon TNT 1-94, partial [Tanacetum coccineum]
TIIVSETKPTTPSVPTEVNDTEQESKLNELTELIQMLINENVNSAQKTQESNSLSHQAESSKSVDLSKTSQDSKPKVHNTGSSKSLRPKPTQKPQLKCELCLYTSHSTDDCYSILYCMKCKWEDHRTTDHEMYTASLKRTKNYKAQPYQYASPSKKILKEKAKPFPPCTHCGFNEHRPDDCKNYPECEICGSYDHFTSGYHHVIEIRGGVLPESSQYRESSIGVKCNTYSTTDNNEFDHFKRGTIIVSETKPTTPSVPTEVNDTEQESKLNELTELIQMLINENVNSAQKTQESNSLSHQAESSKSVDSSKTSQDSKPKVHNTGLSKSLRPKPTQKPQLKCELCLYTSHSTDDCYRILYCMKCKWEDHRTTDHEMYTASLKRTKNYKAQPYQYASPSKKILKEKAKPFPPCTHCGFNEHRPDDCKNYPECEICGSYDHFTSVYHHIIEIRGGVLSESSQYSESSIGVKCNTYSTTDNNEFDHFKRETRQGAHLVPGQWILKEYDWCQELYAQICGATSISQLCDAKYIVQFNDKQGTIFNANKEIVLIAPRRNDVYVLNMSSLTPNEACFFAKASESIIWLWHKRLSHLNFKNINKLAQ